MFLDALSVFRNMGPSFRGLREISGKATKQLDPDAWGLFMTNGGETTLESYNAYQGFNVDFTAIPGEHIDFLKETLFYHEETVEVAMESGTENQIFLFVHAGIAPGVPLEQQDPKDFLWIRDQFLHSNSRFDGRIVVHGHTPNEDVPTKAPRRICVDSGVYMSGPVNKYSTKTWGKLTCCNVLTRDIWQVG
jgi:serine/threonine protein phosphatase 1